MLKKRSTSTKTKKKTKSTKEKNVTEQAITEIENRMKDIMADHKIMKAKVDDNTKEAVSLLKTLIKETPEILAVRWSQYTPGFNDGEPCEFSINDLQLKFNPKAVPVPDDREKDEDEDGQDGFIEISDVDTFLAAQEDVMNFQEVAAIEKKVKLFGQIHQTLSEAGNALEEAFGNNIMITVTAKGIETDDYDCGY